MRPFVFLLVVPCWLLIMLVLNRVYPRRAKWTNAKLVNGWRSVPRPRVTLPRPRPVERP